jgi:hypothetical protein
MSAITSSCGGGRAGRRAWVITSVLFVVLACGAGVSAQEPSTDMDAPTPFASNEVKGAGTSDKTEYFYSFKAGPGEVTLTFDVKADKGANLHGFDYELFDAKSRRLAGGFLDPVRGESKRKVETVNLKGAAPQELVLKVTVTEYVDTYRIRLGGVVILPPAEGAPAPSGGGTPAAQGVETSTPAEATPPAASDAAPAAGSGAQANGERTNESLKKQAVKKAKATARKVGELVYKTPPR